jgi:hypothetical protein
MSFSFQTHGEEMIHHSEVVVIEMTGFTKRETGTGTEKEIETVNVTVNENVIETETGGRTAGTRTEVHILSLCLLVRLPSTFLLFHLPHKIFPLYLCCVFYSFML